MSVQATAGAILAGGQARRFGGRDKCRLIVQGRSIIGRQVELLQRVTDQVLVVGPDPARFADLPVTVVGDVIAGAGALGGILTALESTSADRVLVVACDLPFLTEGLLRALLTLAESGDGAWVETPRGPEPLVACYRQSARGPVRAAITTGRLKAADLGQHLRLHALAGDALSAFGAPAHLLDNLNTPEDYARVQ
jgi:molybdopterin-guanine dinucleotide biosynthesis protein A